MTEKISPDAGSGPQLTRQSRGIMLALLATVVWSFNFIAGRGLADNIPPCTLAAGRWLIAFLAILPLAGADLIRQRRHFLTHFRYYLVVSLLGVSYFNTAIYFAAHTVPALNMSLMACASPLFTIVLARVWFGEVITPARMAGIIVALIGILLLLTRGDLSVLARLSFQGGDLIMLSASLAFSLYTLLVRQRPAGPSQSAYLAATFGLGLVFILPASAWELTHGAVIVVSPALVGGLLYLGLGASLFSFWCWAKAIEAIGPAKASVIYYSVPFFCGLEAVLFLGEPVLWVHYAGGALILGGLLLATRERK